MHAGRYWMVGLPARHTTAVSKYAIGITLVLLASVLWGILAAPKSKKRLPFMQRLLFELAMFFTAAFYCTNAASPY